MDKKIEDIIIGQWSLVEMFIEFDSGERIYPNGKKAIGQLIYLENGIMSAQIGNTERTKSKINDYRAVDKDFTFDNYKEYISYFGTYEVIDSKKYITHEVRMSLFPNWIGQRVKRYFKIRHMDGVAILTLRATKIKVDGELGVPTIVWEKINA
ncbi:MAG: lipocalin-like domain-containing protein [Candidatus Kapaibacteriales bacterium]